jgi:filamentous hemagglutinin
LVPDLGALARTRCASIPTSGTVGGVELRGAGAGAAADFFAGSTYTSKVLGQMGNDLYHGFPMALDSLAAEAGQVTRIVGGDGVAYLSLRVDGAVNGAKGVFEYIKDSAGNINHRLFVPNR